MSRARILTDHPLRIAAQRVLKAWPPVRERCIRAAPKYHGSPWIDDNLNELGAGMMDLEAALKQGG